MLTLKLFSQSRVQTNKSIAFQNPQLSRRQGGSNREFGDKVSSYPDFNVGYTEGTQQVKISL